MNPRSRRRGCEADVDNRAFQFNRFPQYSCCCIEGVLMTEQILLAIENWSHGNKNAIIERFKLNTKE